MRTLYLGKSEAIFLRIFNKLINKSQQQTLMQFVSTSKQHLKLRNSFYLTVKLQSDTPGQKSLQSGKESNIKKMLRQFR